MENSSLVVLKAADGARLNGFPLVRLRPQGTVHPGEAPFAALLQIIWALMSTTAIPRRN